MSDEYMKSRLENERDVNLLNLNRLKKNYVTPIEAVLIFYGIEPSDNDLNDMQTIRGIDQLKLHNVLLNSEFILRYQDSIKLSEFVAWLKEKAYAIPDHLSPLLQKEESCFGKDEILNFDLRKLSNDQLNNLLFRCSAGKFWRNKGKMSAKQYVKVNKDFKNFREKIEKDRGKPYKDKTIEEWISDMSPFSGRKD